MKNLHGHGYIRDKLPVHADIHADTTTSFRVCRRAFSKGFCNTKHSQWCSVTRQAIRAGNINMSEPYRFAVPPTWREGKIANIQSGNFCLPRCGV